MNDTRKKSAKHGNLILKRKVLYLGPILLVDEIYLKRKVIFLYNVSKKQLTNQHY